MLDTALIEKFYGTYIANRTLYLDIERYYNGFTDAMDNYKMQTERSNLKVHTNFLKKFIKEEVSYSVGNDITYISKSSNDEIVKVISEHFSNLSTQHDIELMKNMLKFNKAFELYYIDDEGNFRAKVVSPLEGFVIQDNNDVVAFGREYISKGEEDITYLDIYTKDAIFHYEVGEEYTLTGNSQPNIFGFVPVGIARLGFEEHNWCELVDSGIDAGIFDTLFFDIKGLQDAYETNISDFTNEIADFRNAYLTITGGQLGEGVEANMKKEGILQSNSPTTKFEWLIKKLDSTFIQDNLNNLEDKMYQTSSHINHNEKMQSNLSGLALRSRLISLEEKCKLNQRGLTDCIRVRLKALFTWLNILQGTKYDWKDIKVKFTPNIPQDDLAAAQIIQTLGDKVPLETELSLLSFVENPALTAKKAREEQQEMISDLNNHNNDNLDNTGNDNLNKNDGGNNAK